MINFDLLVDYLVSDESLFEVESLYEFIETMNILGFHRCLHPLKKEKKHLCYQFFNPNFKNESSIPENLYQRNLHLSSNFKGSKQMSNFEGSQLMQRLLQKSVCKNLKVTKLQLAHMRLNFALQKQLDSLRNEQNIVEFQVDDPDSMNNEIAGYYGAVPIEDLKDGFQDYFPIYVEAQKSTPLVPPPEEFPVVEDDVLMPSSEADLLNCLEKEALPIPIQVTPKRPSKKRQHATKGRRNFLKEMEEALMFLHQDSINDNAEE